MRFKYPLIALLCLIPLAAEARDTNDNTKITSRYYATLLNASNTDLTELTMFANLLPKGGDLHNHYSGSIYAETYMDWVAIQNFCIYTNNVYAIQNNEKKLIGEAYHVETKPNSITPDAKLQCMTADIIRNNPALYGEFLSIWSDKDFQNHYHEQIPPDQQFFNTFTYFSSVSDFDYVQGLQILKTRAKAENQQYLETMLKSSPAIETKELTDLFATLNGQSTNVQIDSVLAKAFELISHDPALNQKVENYIGELQGYATTLSDDSFLLKFQAYVSRNSSPAKIFSGLYSAFLSASKSASIVGVNIVGPENRYIALRDYSLHMRMFAFLKSHYPNVNLSLHSGELALGMVPPEAMYFHIREAVTVAGANRIGHGVDIAYEKNPIVLLTDMKNKQVAVEINLTSNDFILGVKNEFHPISLYAKSGVPFVISTDDSGVSRNTLSHEYLLYMSRYKPNYEQLKQTVYNSIQYAFLSGKEKDNQSKKLDEKFKQFEQAISDYSIQNTKR